MGSDLQQGLALGVPADPEDREVLRSQHHVAVDSKDFLDVAVASAPGLLGQPVSEYGRLCQGAGGHRWESALDVTH